MDSVLGGDVGEVDPEDVVEDGVVALPDGVHIRQQEPAAPQAVRDVHVAGAVRSRRSGNRARRTWCEAMAAMPAHFKQLGSALYIQA
jgi:hypothetical protein